MNCFWYPKNINNTVPKQLSNKYGGLDEKKRQVFRTSQGMPCSRTFSSAQVPARQFFKWSPKIIFALVRTNTDTLSTLRKKPIPIPILSYFLLGNGEIRRGYNWQVWCCNWKIDIGINRQRSPMTIEDPINDVAKVVVQLANLCICCVCFLLVRILLLLCFVAFICVLCCVCLCICCVSLCVDWF